MTTLKKQPKQFQLGIIQKYEPDNSNDLAMRLQRSQSEAVRFEVIEAARQLIQTDSAYFVDLPVRAHDIKEEGENVKKANPKIDPIVEILRLAYRRGLAIREEQSKEQPVTSKRLTVKPKT